MFTDKKSILSLPTKVLALTEPHMSNEMNISVDISCKDGLHVGAMILNNTVVEKDATLGMNNYGIHVVSLLVSFCFSGFIFKLF